MLAGFPESPAMGRFKLLRTQGGKVCLSPYQARNTGLCSAKGDIVAFLDIDDLWAPERLSFAAKLHSYGYDMVLARYTVISGTHFIRDIVPVVSTSTLPFVLEILNPIPMLAVSCRRECIGGLRFEGRYHEDFIFWRHLIKLFPGLSVGIASSAPSCACYRYSTQSVSGNKLRAISWIFQIYRLTNPGHLAIASLLAWAILWPVYQLLTSRWPSISYWKLRLNSLEPLGKQG
jgi:teichuronic acid biosynthesis glycosyltransferase TuaG